MQTTGAQFRQIVGNTWWHLLIWGIVFALLGLSLLTWPVKTVAVLFTLVAIFLLVDGVMDLVSSVIHRDAGWGWRLVGGIIGIVAGLFLLSNPLLGGISLVLFTYYVLAFAAIIKGIIRIVGGKRTADEVGYHWSWSNFFLGLLEMLIGIFLLANVLSGAIALLFILAIIALVGGIVLIVQSFRLRNLMARIA
jgi:Short repeat of unknown function (DUF308)